MVIFVVGVVASIVVIVTRPMLVSIVVAVSVVISPVLILNVPGVSSVQIRDLLDSAVNQVRKSLQGRVDEVVLNVSKSFSCNWKIYFSVFIAKIQMCQVSL